MGIYWLSLTRIGVGACYSHQPLRRPGQESEEFDGDPLANANGSTPRYYNNARWYRPEWFRYTQRDPIGIDGGTNLYSYTPNNSLSMVDAHGTYAAAVGGLGLDLSVDAAVGFLEDAVIAAGLAFASPEIIAALALIASAAVVAAALAILAQAIQSGALAQDDNCGPGGGSGSGDSGNNNNNANNGGSGNS